MKSIVSRRQVLLFFPLCVKFGLFGFYKIIFFVNSCSKFSEKLLDL
jgi:hypothetical protein